MLTNFHTHHKFCRHAIGNVEDYVIKAIKEQYDIIGISDHAPMPKYYKDRMKESEFSCYLQEIYDCKNKYSDKIKIYSGVEIEFFPELNDDYQLLKQNIDYLVLACHDYLYNGKEYCAFFINNDYMLEGYFKTLIKGIETKLFNFAAHPDLFGVSYHFNELASYYTHLLAKTCLKYDFILEFNANGFRKGKANILGEFRHPYPYKPFWDIIKQYQVKVIVNSDCHNPNFLNDDFEKKARMICNDIGLNVVETIF